MIVTAPGLYDLDERTYHADTALAPELGRSLSASGAKTLLKSPARFAYERANPSEPTPAMELGTAVHTTVFGTGQEVVYVAASWQGKAAAAERAAIRAEGKLPMLAKDRAQIEGMAASVRNHPEASRVLADGRPEVSAYWIDPDTGITCRARYDWLRNDGRVADLKTTQDATDKGLQKALVDFGYDLSGVWYPDGLEVLTGERPSFTLVFVEKTPPYMVRVVYNLADDAQERGARLAREARHLFAEHESNGWPTSYESIEELSLPRWAA